MEKKKNQRRSRENFRPSEQMTVGADDEGTRLDRFCAANIESISRNQLQKLNEAGHVTVDGIRRPDHYALREGETVLVAIPVTPEDVAPRPQQIPVSIVYEDDHIAIVNKSAGIVVHPAHGNPDGTLVNALLGRGIELSDLGSPDRPGIVHRLDKDTSGLMVVAKSDDAYRKLSDDIKARRMRKTYHAIVWGNLGTSMRTIDAPIARHPVMRQKMAVASSGGREAVTEVFVVDSFEYFDYIRVVTLTGRTHQIRVHLSHISHPILGDDLYGGRRSKVLLSKTRLRHHISAMLKAMPRQALHASRLSLEHPVTGSGVDFKTALPDDMRTVLEKLHSGIKEATN